jgi:hypothetical protein
MQPIHLKFIMKNPLWLFAIFSIAMLAVGCNQSNSSPDNPPSNNTNSMSVTQAMQNVREVATNAWEKTKEATTNAWNDVKESMQSAANYSYDKKDAFVADASADLAAMDQEISELADKTANASDDAKADAQAKLQELRAKRAILDQKLTDVKNSTEATWNDK